MANPWATQSRARAYATDDAVGAEMDASYMDTAETEICGICGAVAYLKMTIGTHKCPDCGAIRCGEDWR